MVEVLTHDGISERLAKELRARAPREPPPRPAAG